MTIQIISKLPWLHVVKTQGQLVFSKWAEKFEKRNAPQLADHVEWVELTEDEQEYNINMLAQAYEFFALKNQRKDKVL